MLPELEPPELLDELLDDELPELEPPELLDELDELDELDDSPQNVWRVEPPHAASAPAHLPSTHAAERNEPLVLHPQQTGLQSE